MSITWFQKLVGVLVWLVVALGLAAAAKGDTPPDNHEAPFALAEPALGTAALADNYSATTTAASARMREGEKIADLVGEFQKSGDRFTFSTQDGKMAIRVLENLLLERVARSLEDDPALRLWSASGVITEFRGENYLMLTRAVLKPRAILPRQTAVPDNNKKKE